MVQVPVATPVTVVPLTVQTVGVAELKITRAVEPPPVALTDEVPSTFKSAGKKVIMPIEFGSILVALTLFVTVAALLKLLSPACSNFTIQIPVPDFIVKVAPLLVQTVVSPLLYVTARLESEVAPTVNELL